MIAAVAVFTHARDLPEVAEDALGVITPEFAADCERLRDHYGAVRIEVSLAGPAMVSKVALELEDHVYRLAIAARSVADGAADPSEEVRRTALERARTAYLQMNYMSDSMLRLTELTRLALEDDGSNRRLREKPDLNRP
ncbi:hypothetical protein [Streptomyces sp. NPDC127108]|uniref:hypothetical protein n=1 Tax=Streptomyces sp. NPDC127108 TaxID=3345361 RepID=UPI0036387E53